MAASGTASCAIMPLAAEGPGGGVGGFAEPFRLAEFSSIFFVFVAVFFAGVVPSERTPILRSGGWNRRLHFGSARDIPRLVLRKLDQLANAIERLVKKP